MRVQGRDNVCEEDKETSFRLHASHKNGEFPEEQEIPRVRI